MKLGKYDNLEEIGKGSFGTVYKARDTALDIDVALKLLKPVWMDDRKAVELFYREARAAARLEHPNIVHIRDVGEIEGRLFIAMQLVDGAPLNEVIQQNGAMPLAQAVPIARQIADALDYAHAQGLVHRDIKPGNILIRKDGRVMLTDFGLARGAEQASLMSSASVGGAVGTPEYVAPELWKGAVASPKSDEYAFACVVYEMLAGKALFSGSSGPEVMFKHFGLPRLDALPDPRLRDALAAALVADAGARPSERELVARLQAVADGPAPAPKPILVDGTAGAPTHAAISTKPAPAEATAATPAGQPKPKTRWGWALAPVLLLGSIVAWLAGQNPHSPAPTPTPTVAPKLTETVRPSDNPTSTPTFPNKTINPSSTPSLTKIFVTTPSVVATPIIPPSLITAQPQATYEPKQRDAAQAGQCNLWILANDFKIFPAQENPNRDSCGNLNVWYFLRSTTLSRTPQTYVLLKNFVSNAFDLKGFEQWQGDHIWPTVKNIKLPSVGINSTNESRLIETARHPAHSIVAHPWQTNELIIIGWKSPVTGFVAISGSMEDMDPKGGDGISWFIDKNSINIANGEFSDGGKQIFMDGKGGSLLSKLQVSSDDFIYFVVNPKQNDNFDTTKVDISIKLVD